RRRAPSLVVDMGEDLESEIGVLVQHLQAARHLLAAIGLDEVAVREQLLEFQANLFAALGAAIAGKNGAAIRDELIEVVGHCCLLRTTLDLASLIAPASARAMAPTIQTLSSARPRRLSSAHPREGHPATLTSRGPRCGDPVLGPGFPLSRE